MVNAQKYTVGHTTYKYGDKQEDETCFDNEIAAREFARDMLSRHGGRAWINNEEVKGVL